MSESPSAQQIAFAILASLPREISYSGSDVWEVTAVNGLGFRDGDGGAPYATVLSLKGVGTSFTVIVAATEDLSERDDHGYRTVTFDA